MAFIDTFYSKSNNSQRNHAVDRLFQEKVWSWLTRNPEVSVGRDRQGNHLSLADVELTYTTASNQSDTKSEFLDGGEKPRAIPLRLFVSEERTWRAITGHEPDETKVLPTEFALLSVIASTKSSGIIQPELVKISGQDKRSVPKRTNMLQKKGYIIKTPIHIRGTRTSLCTLSKFFHDKAPRQTGETAADHTTDDMTQADEYIDFGAFLTQMFSILREYRLISRSDLKRMLGFTDAWRMRILSRALRKLERIGVLKRVRAMSQYSGTKKSFYSCVMLVRDPSPRDFDLFNEYGENLVASLKESRERLDVDNDDFDQDDTAALDMEPEAVVKRESDVVDTGRPLPTWTPDRCFHNQVFHTIDRERLGLTSNDILRLCFGEFFRKPLESMMTRLVECWQLAQPPHLRHFAIVRDTAVTRRMTQYVHYTARNFQLLVDAGQASWEAVEYIRKHDKSDPPHVPPIDAVPELDSYGLPLITNANELVRNGNATLLECIIAGHPEDYVRSNSDAMPVQRDDGTYSK